jgi:hypothetical protein
VPKLFQKILALILSLVILIITGGINIYTHHCSCSQVFEISVTAFGDDCCDHNDHHSCNIENADAQSCCSSCDNENSQHVCSIDGCCTYTHDYLKISENFDRTAPLLLKISETEIPADFVTQIYKDDHLEFAVLHIANNSSPPPVFVGKKYVVFTHSLKIAPAFHFSA